MTRQIICLKCAERKPGEYPGEWWHREQGRARGFKNGDFVCDQCNTTIPKGTECVAQSFGRDNVVGMYYPWEHEYLGVGVVAPAKRMARPRLRKLNRRGKPHDPTN